MRLHLQIFYFFFFNDTATTEIYTLSLHDALPIFEVPRPGNGDLFSRDGFRPRVRAGDRKSTRLNSSHQIISYAVFCLKKKKTYDEFILWLNVESDNMVLRIDVIRKCVSFQCDYKS